MIRLCQHISYLLTRHDCVIVPGFGGFIATYVSANYNAVSNELAPPRREVSFNASLSHNDGLLAGSIARRESLSYERACEAMMHEVEAMKTALASEGHLVIDGVGSLTTADGATPSFEPCISGAANAGYSFLPVLTPHAESVSEETPVEEKMTAASRSLRGAWRAVAGTAASVALLLGLGFTLTMPSGQPQPTGYASMAPVRASATFTDDVMSATDLFIAIPGEGSWVETDTAAHSRYVARMRFADGLATAKASHKAAVKNEAAGNNADNKKLSATNPGGPYRVVVASLTSRAQAEKWISQQGDPRLKIAKAAAKRYRVYVASAATEEAARQARDSNSTRYPGAWIAD